MIDPKTSTCLDVFNVKILSSLDSDINACVVTIIIPVIQLIQRIMMNIQIRMKSIIQNISISHLLEILVSLLSTDVISFQDPISLSRLFPRSLTLDPISDPVYVKEPSSDSSLDPDTKPRNIQDASYDPSQVDSVTFSPSISSMNSNCNSCVHPDCKSSGGTNTNHSLVTSSNTGVVLTILPGVDQTILKVSPSITLNLKLDTIIIFIDLVL